MPREISCVQILDGCKRLLGGSERTVISDLLDLIKTHDPDLILLPYADTWVPLIVRKARRYGLEPTFSRTGWFKPMGSKSYWSYGRVNHKDGALIPESRVLIDTAKSFVYAESGLKGVLMASRLSGLSPNLTSRFTPGTLISSYEVFEALRRGVAVPFRKRDAEGFRNISDLRACDKGGMMFQPEPGVYEKVHQIDFTSLYPSIIVKYNLSPETIEHPEMKGFLSTVLSSLLNLRIETKRLKKTNPDYSGIDSVLKWMLVTCFGYTGYRNAKFGQIQVHERITGISRVLLMQIKDWLKT
jgi:DNA polymerase I